jgi:putative endonuclease
VTRGKGDGEMGSCPFCHSEEAQRLRNLMTNEHQKVMYAGVTSDLKRRLFQHRNKSVKGFTEKYNIHKLVYYEATSDVVSAIAREREIKKWRREKKNRLVKTINPDWKDLSAVWG